MLYVNRIEDRRIFVTDTDDNITECIDYFSLYNLVLNNLIDVYGVSIESNKLAITKFKKNSIVINALLGNSDAIRLYSEYADCNIIDLNLVSMSSNKDVFWSCSTCHGLYKMSPNKRLHCDRHRNCPYCSGQSVLKGFNDVATTHSYVLQDWDYSKNIISPTEITAGSSKVIWFLCNECGCSYSSPLSTKTRQDRLNLGCPDCAARRNKMGYSLNEKFIFDFLSKYVVCKDRVHLDKLEFDIFIPSLNTLIEYDGNYWHEFESKIKRDTLKNNYAKSHGYHLIRIRESNLQPLLGCENIMMKDFNNDIALVCNHLLSIMPI